jgi:CBS domain-containing protein
MPVRDAVSHEVISIRSDKKLLVARGIMDRGEFRHVPVVERGRMVGIVTTHDMRGRIERLEPVARRRPRRWPARLRTPADARQR